MPSDDPTKKYPPSENYKTNPMLETILHELREGFARVEKEAGEFRVETTQKFERLEKDLGELKKDLGEFRLETQIRLDHLEKGQKELMRSFRHSKVETEGRLVELEDRLEALETPPRS